MGLGLCPGLGWSLSLLSHGHGHYLVFCLCLCLGFGLALVKVLLLVWSKSRSWFWPWFLHLSEMESFLVLVLVWYFSWSWSLSFLCPSLGHHLGYGLKYYVCYFTFSLGKPIIEFEYFLFMVLCVCIFFKSQDLFVSTLSVLFFQHLAKNKKSQL